MLESVEVWVFLKGQGSLNGNFRKSCKSSSRKFQWRQTTMARRYAGSTKRRKRPVSIIALSSYLDADQLDAGSDSHLFPLFNPPTKAFGDELRFLYKLSHQILTRNSQTSSVIETS